MWQLIFGGIGSILNPIASIANKIADAKVELAKAQTDKERVAAQERVETLQARRDVMVAEGGGPYGWINATMRGLLALGPTILLLKIFVYDKAFGQWTNGTTDALDPNLWQVVTIVLGFYFLDNIVARFKR